MVSGFASDSLLVVLRIILTSFSIVLDCRPWLSVFVCTGSSLWAYYHGYYYEFLVDQLRFFKASMMGLRGQDSCKFLLSLEWITALERKKKVIFGFRDHALVCLSLGYVFV